MPSEFRYPGFKQFCPVKNNLQKDTKPTMEEFMSVLVSEVIRCFDGTCIMDFSTAFSQDKKNLVILYSVSNCFLVEMKWVGLWYRIYQLILKQFQKVHCWMPGFLDFGELISRPSSVRAYPYSGLDFQAHSSFYLRGLNLCAPQKVCCAILEIELEAFLPVFPNYAPLIQKYM